MYNCRVLLDYTMADRAAAANGGAPQQQRGTSWWTFLRSFAIQVAIFYFISSFFRGQKQPVDQDGQAVAPSINLFRFGQKVVRMLGTCVVHSLVCDGFLWA